MLISLAFSLIVLAQDVSDDEWRQAKEASTPLVESGSQSATGAGEPVSVVRIVAWSAVVLGLMVGLFFGIKRWQTRGAPPGGEELINITVRRRISPTLELLVVEIEGRRLLLGASKEGLTTLAELGTDEPPEKTFAEVMGGKLGPIGAKENAPTAELGVGGFSPS